MTSRSQLMRWQTITAGVLFVGYAGYYVCRSNLSVATPLLLAEYGPLGLTKADLGFVASVGVAMYALGKVCNVLADYIGGRTMFLAGMVASIACTIAFGLVGPLTATVGVAAFATVWAANRFVQSMGWGALVKTASRWFPLGVHATVMGFLSMSFLVGDAAARLYLGGVIHLGESAPDGSSWTLLADWRVVFFLSAATLGVIALLNYALLRTSPRDVGCEEPDANPANVFGAGGNSAQRVSLGQLLLPLLTSQLFWLVCALNFGLTLIRETFNFWNPTYLQEVAGLTIGRAGMLSLLFPLVGGMSALTAGVLSDRLRGRHGRVVVPALLLLVGALTALALIDTTGRPVLALSLICAVSFFLMAPYSYLSGVVALDLGGKRGSATAAGLSDAAGYLGAILSGWAVGAIAERYGWSAAFLSLAGIGVVSLLVAVAFWLRQEVVMNRAESLQRALEPPPPVDSSTAPEPAAAPTVP